MVCTTLVVLTIVVTVNPVYGMYYFGGTYHSGDCEITDNNDDYGGDTNDDDNTRVLDVNGDYEATDM